MPFLILTEYYFFPPCSLVLDVQNVLLKPANKDVEIGGDFVLNFSDLSTVHSRWPLLASLLSFTTAEIEQIKREVIGVPSVKAAAMMNRWRERTTATYGTLLSKVSCSLNQGVKASDQCMSKLSVPAYLTVLLLLTYFNEADTEVHAA